MAEALAYLNSAACVVLLGFLLVVAIVMPKRGMWGKRIVVILTTLAVGFDVALLPIMLALMLIVWRREAWVFIRCKFVVPDGMDNVPKRRTTDWADLSGAELRHTYRGHKR